MVDEINFDLINATSSVCKQEKGVECSTKELLPQEIARLTDASQCKGAMQDRASTSDDQVALRIGQVYEAKLIRPGKFELNPKKPLGPVCIYEPEILQIYADSMGVELPQSVYTTPSKLDREMRENSIATLKRLLERAASARVKEAMPQLSPDDDTDPFKSGPLKGFQRRMRNHGEDSRADSTFNALLRYFGGEKARFKLSLAVLKKMKANNSGTLVMPRDRIRMTYNQVVFLIAKKVDEHVKKSAK